MGTFKNETYRKLFAEDTERIFKSVRENLPLLGSGQTQKAALTVMCRNAHSLKGLSAFIGLEAARSVSEKLESRLREYSEGTNLPLTDKSVQEVTQAFHDIEDSIKKISKRTFFQQVISFFFSRKN